VWCVLLGEPLLCRLSFHKWRNYGNQVEISWKEPDGETMGVRSIRTLGTHEQQVELDSMFTTRSEAVYEGRECKRCGIRLRRRLVTNSDGTLSSVGWKSDTEDARNH
jgi:hypothetical protein